MFVVSDILTFNDNSMESHQGSYDQPTIGDKPTKSLDNKTKYTPRELSAVQLVNICHCLAYDWMAKYEGKVTKHNPKRDVVRY